MGGILSTVLNTLWGKREYRILILGLDGAGKTTILYRLQTGETVSTIPSTPFSSSFHLYSTFLAIGFNVESVKIKNIKFQMWDLGGQSSIRPYWRCYYANTDGIVFVVDSADIDRAGAAKAELSAMLHEEELKGVPLLVLANKQDLPGSQGPAELSELLDLVSLKERPWHLQTSTATSGMGLEEGFDWLFKTIKAS